MVPMNEREVIKMSAWTKVVGGYIATNKGVEYFAQENRENIVLKNNKNNDVFFFANMGEVTTYILSL